MTVTPSLSLGIDFGAIAGKEVTPKGAADTILSQAVSTGNLQTFSCRAVLAPAQLVEVETYATQLYPNMLANTTVLSNFGVQSLDGVNATVSRMLAEQGKLDIPDVDKITRGLNDVVSKFRGKYDPKKSEVKKAFDAFDSWKDNFLNIVRGVRNLLDDLYQDSLTVGESLDRSAAALEKDRLQLQRNVILCDELYDQNEVAIKQLVGVIAIMEQIRDNAQNEAEKLGSQINAAVEGSVEKRDLSEQRTRIVELIGDLDIRINEFVQRLFVAWTTSPQIRNIRKISYGLDQRLGLLIQMTIPVLKLTTAIRGTLLQAEEAAKVKEGVDNITNDALNDLSALTAVAVPKVAQIIQAPSIKPQTLINMADSIIAQNEGIEAAVREGKMARAQVIDAVVTAGQRITASGKKLDEAVLDLVTRAQQPLAMPPAPVISEEFATV